MKENLFDCIISGIYQSVMEHNVKLISNQTKYEEESDHMHDIHILMAL